MMTKLFKVLFVIFVITVFPAKAKESFNGIIKYSIVVQSLSENLLEISHLHFCFFAFAKNLINEIAQPKWKSKGVTCIGSRIRKSSC